MRIIVATCYTPFTYDRNERLARELTAQLTQSGHHADVVLLPVHPDLDAGQQLLSRRLIDLTGSAGQPVDRLIAVGQAAMALRHPDLTGWFVDTVRTAGPLSLSEARRAHYASVRDAHVARASRPLYPPIADPAGLEPASPEPLVVWAGTLAPQGRVAHALEAMRFARPGLRLSLLADTAPAGEVERLLERAREWRLAGRVEVMVGPTPAARRERVRRCLGVLALHADQPAPHDAVIEAFHARRPVLTYRDTVAVAGLVEDGANGLVVSPDPRQLAASMNRLEGDLALGRRLGEGAFTTLTRNGINWPNVAERLLL